MVTRWGLSDNLCPLAYQEEEGEVFLGQSVTQHKHISEDTAKQVDAEVRAIIDRNYERAERLLNEHLATLHAMAEALITYETLDSDQIDDLMAGRAPREPKEPTDDGGGSVRQAPTRAEGDIVGPPAEQPA